MRVELRDLDRLRSETSGRRLLQEELTFDDPACFLDHLTAPARVTTGGLPIYGHQQVYLDYRASVVAKFQALRALGALRADIRTDFVWIDTDRCGSDRLSLRLYLEGPQGAVPVRLAPAGCEAREPRFVQTDPQRLRQAVDHVEAVLHSAAHTRDARLERWRTVRPLIEAGGTLSALSRRLTDVLLQGVLGFIPKPVLTSDIAASGTLNESLGAILNRLPDFVATFNERIETLRGLGIDPMVRPLAEDYLPLFITMPGDQRRTRLRLVRDGSVHLACATNRAGQDRCYELGHHELSMAQLDGRASVVPDVTLPILLNDMYSGVVCGKSSALYLLVFNDVMRKVLDMTPVPVLVPPSWDVFPAAFDSLLGAYLDGRKV